MHRYESRVLLQVWWGPTSSKATHTHGEMCARCGVVKEQSIRTILAMTDDLNAKHPRVHYELHPNIWRSVP